MKMPTKLLAETILDWMQDQKSYITNYGTEVTIDGHIDLQKLAEFLTEKEDHF